MVFAKNRLIQTELKKYIADYLALFDSHIPY